MKVLVTAHYESPYENPINVLAGEFVVVDFTKSTDIKGWVWCTAKDGRSGWTPKQWLIQSNGKWKIIRSFNAIELAIEVGETLEVVLEESGFYWAKKANGDTGWIPCENVK